MKFFMQVSSGLAPGIVGETGPLAKPPPRIGAVPALLEELIKRRLEHTPIEWQPGVAEKITAMGMVDVNESSPECVVDWPVDKEG
jgi:hypothetical protein